jgi:hypothetical protein
MYDCSGMPALSFGAGAVTILTGLLVFDRVYIIAGSSAPPGARLATALVVGALGAAVTLTLGWITRITHICG